MKRATGVFPAGLVLLALLAPLAEARVVRVEIDRREEWGFAREGID